MNIGEIIKSKDFNSYKKLEKLCREPKKEKKKDDVKLGDSVTNLMKANSYKRVNGALRQTRWE